LANLGVNLHVCLCGDLQVASAQTLDFLDIGQKSSFPDWKLSPTAKSFPDGHCYETWGGLPLRDAQTLIQGWRTVHVRGRFGFCGGKTFVCLSPVRGRPRWRDPLPRHGTRRLQHAPSGPGPLFNSQTGFPDPNLPVNGEVDRDGKPIPLGVGGG